MPAYVIFIRESEVRDPAAMDQYRTVNRGRPPEPRPTPLVVYGAQEALEGAAPDGVVILQFPSREAALNWYRSPEYQQAIPFRQRAADYRAFVVDGL